MMHEAGAVAFGEDQLDGDVGEGPGGGAGVLGEEDDRNLGHDLFELARGLQAVEDRHGNVEDDEVGPALNGEVDGFLAVAGFGAEFVILLGLEHFAEHFADERIVVSDENRSGHGHPVAAQPRSVTFLVVTLTVCGTRGDTGIAVGGYRWQDWNLLEKDFEEIRKLAPKWNGAGRVLVLIVRGRRDFENGADFLAAGDFDGRAAALVEPFAEGFEFDVVGYRDILDRDLDVADVGIVAGDPVGVAQSFEGQGDGFVKGAGGDVDGMLGAFAVAEGDFAGFEFHGRSVTGSLFVRQGKNGRLGGVAVGRPGGKGRCNANGEQGQRPARTASERRRDSRDVKVRRCGPGFIF